MAIHAEVRKTSETVTQVRYSFSDSSGTERFMVLDKVAEKCWPEDGVDNVLYRAVAGKVATAWLRGGAAPERIVVAS